MSEEDTQRQYERAQADAEAAFTAQFNLIKSLAQNGELPEPKASTPGLWAIRADRESAADIIGTPATTDEVLRRILAKLEAIHREIVAQRRGYTPGA